MLWPLMEVLRYSLTDWNGLSATYNYVGLTNYKNLVHIDGFGQMMFATVTFAIGTTIITIIVSFITALALDKKGRGRLPRGMMRSLWFLPALLSGAVVGLLWRVMYNFNNGVINKGLTSIGLNPINWLETVGVANIAIIIGAAWVQIGFCVIVFLAGLQSISQEMFEAAAIDGANKWKQITNITIPLLTPTIVLLQILAVGRIFNGDFDMFYSLPNGSGPLKNVSTTLDVYVYNTMKSGAQLGLASAAAFFQSIVGKFRSFIGYSFPSTHTVPFSILILSSKSRSSIPNSG